MLWALYGLLHSFLRAVQVETNRLSRLDSKIAAFGQALIGFLLLLPFAHWMAWPSDPHFYRAAAGVSVIFAIGMVIHLDLSAEKVGRISGIYMPFETLGALLLWVVILPSMVDFYKANPVQTAGIAAAFVLATAGLLKIRPGDWSIRNFILVAPLGITYAVAGTVTKTVMPDDPVWPAALAYTLITFAVMTLVLGFTVITQKKLHRSVVTARNLRTFILTGLASVGGYAAFVISVALAPNPGYTCMLAMLLPVWLLIGHGLMRVEDKARAIPALMIIIGSFLLIVAVW